MKLIAGSLTTFIKRNRDFWNAVCPDISKTLTIVNQELRASPVLVPMAIENRPFAGPLGTAVDYYIGWTAGALLLEQAKRIATPLTEDARMITALVASHLDRLRKKKAALSRIELERLGRLCLVLAQMESAYRTGNRQFIPPAAGLKIAGTWACTDERVGAWLAERVPAGRVAEWLALAEQVRRLPISWRGAIYNPVFGGYRLIRGADGDLIVNGVLYEVKCSVDTFDGDAIRQLLGYCVLNILNERGLAISRIGLINVRRRFVWSEDVEAVCRAVGASRLSRLTVAMKQGLERPRM